MKSFIILLVISLSISCQSKDESSLSKIKELEEREIKISAKENELAVRENELTIREAQIDSLKLQIKNLDTLGKKISGKWNVEMECTETSCSGSAIGDVRSEQWNINLIANEIIVQSYLNKKALRTYTGTFKDNFISLSVKKEKISEAEIDISLQIKKENVFEGNRTITQKDGCKIVYAIKGEKL